MSEIKLELIPDEDPRLHTKSEVFNPRSTDFDLSKTIDAMFQLMWDNKGMGLAAPQVGINKRFFIMYHPDTSMCYICINPRILKMGKQTYIDSEGCLSYPGETLKVERAKEVKVAYQNKNGNRVEKTFRGILARCFQHELDHLDGIVFKDRAIT